MNIGVQTFTIRKHQKKDMEKSYLPLIRTGIKSFEVARIDFTPENAEILKEIVEKHGIEISAIQVKPKYVFGAAESIINFCKTVGCKRVIISMLPFPVILGKEEKFYEFIGTLDTQFDLYAKHGITLGYHHHNWEYVTLSNGKTRMDELLAKTKRIKIVHDTYWTARCGIDPIREIARFGNRLLGVHLRDLTHYAKGLEVKPRDCAIGYGVIDFARVIPMAIEMGAEYLVIEQKTKDPYTEIYKSYNRSTSILNEGKYISERLEDFIQ